MKKAIAVLLLLVLAACGGAPARDIHRSFQQPGKYEARGGGFNEHDGSYVLTRDNFPELYKLGLNMDTTRLSSLLGSPGSLKISLTYSGSSKLVVLEAGTSPDGQSRTREGLLYYAMKKGMLKKARELLELGADPNSKNMYGQTLLHLLLDAKNEMPKRLKMVNLLLDNGADPNEPSRYMPLLQTAIASGDDDREKIVEALLEHGADPGGEYHGRTALHAAVDFEPGGKGAPDEETIIALSELMLDSGADINARDSAERTPLYLAKRHEYKDLIRFLEDRGATDFGKKQSWSGFADFQKYEPKKSVLGIGSGEILDLDAEACHSILQEHGVQFDALADIQDVKIPIRLGSDVDGITYRHTGGSRTFSIMDCRLAVALVGWAPVLKEHKVKEILHMRSYSPGARVGGGSKVSGHNYALAIDVARFIFEDGSELAVKDDWTDRRRKADPCTVPETGDSEAQDALRSIACDTGNMDLFSMILTPHYNRAHHDHLHMEVTDEVFMYLR